MTFEDGNNMYFMFYFYKSSKKFTLKNLLELLFNSTFRLKFSCSTTNEWNLVYNKNSNNYILVIQ